MNCYVCSSYHIKLYKTIKIYRLFKCKSCGVIFLDRENLSSDLSRFYDQKYFDDYLYDLNYEVKQVKDTLRYYIDLLSYHYFKPDKILDVGAGIGLMVKAFRDLGFDADGVEVSSYACKVALENFELNLFNGTLLDYKTENKYDMIVFYHSFEHLENPLKILDKVKNLLCDGGLLWLSLPNVMSLDRFLNKENWNGWSLPYHLFHYSPSSIERLLRLQNFKEIKIMKGFLNPFRILIKREKQNSQVLVEKVSKFSILKEFIRMPATLVFSNQNMNVFAIK